MKITVTGMVDLVLVATRNGEAKYAEFYANWETGNYLTVPATTSTEDVVKLYKEKFFTPVV